MRQVFFRAKEAQSRPVESWEGGEYRDVASPRQRPQGLSGLERWGPTHTGTPALMGLPPRVCARPYILPRSFQLSLLNGFAGALSSSAGWLGVGV